jgi:hypothetical protein
MGKAFIVPKKLLPLVEDIRLTLVEDCEKDVRIEVGGGRSVTAWLRVHDPKREKKNGVVRASGAIGPNRCKLLIKPGGASFETDSNSLDMAEQIFFLFIKVISVYRTARGLSPLNTRIVDGFAAEDSPPVNAENYAVFPPGDKKINKLAALVNKNFLGVSCHVQVGRFCYYICSTVCQVRLSPIHIPVYTAMIDSFTAAFPVKDARLLAVRYEAAQRLYFVTEEDRVYHCKTDDSLEFLQKYAGRMFDSLSAARRHGGML